MALLGDAASGFAVRAGLTVTVRTVTELHTKPKTAMQVEARTDVITLQASQGSTYTRAQTRGNLCQSFVLPTSLDQTVATH